MTGDLLFSDFISNSHYITIINRIENINIFYSFCLGDILAYVSYV